MRAKGAALIGVVLALLMTGHAAADRFSDAGVERPQTRLQAPPFSLELLSDGSQASLADYQGKVILLNFWATWCAPCREEMPAMQTLWERYRSEGFEILAVAADRRGRKNVAPFITEHGFKYPILLDADGTVRNRYEVVGLPMSYLIGRDGKISGRVVGVIDWTSRDAIHLIETMLQQSPP